MERLLVLKISRITIQAHTPEVKFTDRCIVSQCLNGNSYTCVLIGCYTDLFYLLSSYHYIDGFTSPWRRFILVYSFSVLGQGRCVQSIPGIMREPDSCRARVLPLLIIIMEWLTVTYRGVLPPVGWCLPLPRFADCRVSVSLFCRLAVSTDFTVWSVSLIL